MSALGHKRKSQPGVVTSALTPNSRLQGSNGGITQPRQGRRKNRPCGFRHPRIEHVEAILLVSRTTRAFSVAEAVD